MKIICLHTEMNAGKKQTSRGQNNPISETRNCHFEVLDGLTMNINDFHMAEAVNNH